MTMEISELASALKQEFCNSIAVTQVERDLLSLTLPMIFDDGDSLPVLIRVQGDRALLTDFGMTVSHLFFDDFVPTAARLKKLRQVIEFSGAHMDDQFKITMEIDGTLDVYGIGDFVQVIAQVRGVATALQVERDQYRFSHRISDPLVRLLRTAEFDLDWTPPNLGDRGRRYVADVRVAPEGGGTDVVIFAAGTSDRANVSALAVNVFEKSGAQIQPILVVPNDRTKVSGEAVSRFQDAADNGRVIEADSGDDQGLVEALEDLGVPVG